MMRACSENVDRQGAGPYSEISNDPHLKAGATPVFLVPVCAVLYLLAACDSTIQLGLRGKVDPVKSSLARRSALQDASCARRAAETPTRLALRARQRRFPAHALRSGNL